WGRCSDSSACCWPCRWPRSPRCWCATACANTRKARFTAAETVAPMSLPSNPDEPRGQLPLELGHTPAQGEADFLVGEGNALAHGRIMAFPHWPDPVTLLIGPAKSGKSHLARIFADRSGAR